MEVDLSQNTALFYCAPDILKDIKDLQNIKIALQTKGYENYEGNNIVISVGVLAKASNRSGMKYKVNIEGIVNTIASKSIKMIDPVRIDPEELAGLEWSLDEVKEQDNEILVPKKSYIFENIDGSKSLRFVNFSKETSKDESEAETNYTFMNEEVYNTEPIYDTEREEDEDILDMGFNRFGKEEYEYDYTLEYLEEEEIVYKTEQTNKTIDQIIDRKFTEFNIQEEVDDMLIECMTELGLTYEESYNKLQQYFNLPLATDISQGKIMISDFYKQ